MSASKFAKKHGAGSVRELAQYYELSEGTIQNWHKSKKVGKRRLLEAAAEYYAKTRCETQRLALLLKG